MLTTISTPPHRYSRILLILGIGLFLQNCGQGKSENPGRNRGASGNALVEAIIVKPRPLENKIFSTGTIQANEEVQLRPEIAGRIVRIDFQEGSLIRKGQLLVSIDDSELRAQLKRKEFEEKLAEEDERRKRSLLEVNGISKSDYDKSLNTLNMLKAEKDVIESQIAKTAIKAPFDGLVGLRYVSEGSYVTSSMLIATVQEVNPVKVDFAVPERYAHQIAKGTPIQLQIDNNEATFKGSVYAVEAKIDQATRTLKARGVVPNPERRLIPGSFAKIEIALERVADALVIPAEAVIPELNGDKVFIVKNGKAHASPIKIGIRTERDVQVVGGLTANDTLIVSGILQLSEGKGVDITFRPEL